MEVSSGLAAVSRNVSYYQCTLSLSSGHRCYPECSNVFVGSKISEKDGFLCTYLKNWPLSKNPLESKPSTISSFIFPWLGVRALGLQGCFPGTNCSHILITLITLEPESFKVLPIWPPICQTQQGHSATQNCCHESGSNKLPCPCHPNHLDCSDLGSV